MKGLSIFRALGVLALFWVSVSVQAQNGAVTITRLQVLAQPAAADLQCGTPPRVPKPERQADPDPLEWPSQVEVDRQVKAFYGDLTRRPQDFGAQGPSVAQPLWPHPGGLVLRLGIWGDSHLAAGFFTQELQRLSKLASDQVRSRFMPANFGRSGVRLPLRKICLSPDWQYESAHSQSTGTALPGPGLVSMSSRQDGAWLALDLRNSAGQAEHLRVTFLYQQTAQPVRVALSVDSGPEQVLVLQADEGSAALELIAQSAMSTVAMRVLQGPLRLHGMERPVASSVRLQMDVFGQPGATVGGWRLVQPDLLSAWWPATPYDVVVLAFGTNEGNVQPFNASAYRQMLQLSVSNWRAVFPIAACLLIAPGDRGVLQRRSHKGIQSAPYATEKATPDVLRFSRVHEEIGRIQKQVAQAHGCRVWSIYEAMGGAGSAYRWARHNPPLMARDLIHFTVPGYQRLAQLMAQDLGWGPALFGDVPSPAAPR